MPHSQSENNIDFRAPPTNVHSLRVGKVFVVRGDNTARSSEESGESSFSRGRSVSRTPSPVKLLEDIKEAQSPESPLPPTKRARSPIKQLFGEGGWLGKSTSMKEPPDEEYRKKGIKHWGGKLKQRVEDLVGPDLLFMDCESDREADGGCVEICACYSVSAQITVQVITYQVQVLCIPEPS